MSGTPPETPSGKAELAGPAESGSGSAEVAGDAVPSAHRAAEAAVSVEPTEPEPGGVGGADAASETMKSGVEPDAGETASNRTKPVDRGISGRVLLPSLVAAVVLLIAAIGVAGYLFVQERDKDNLLTTQEEARRAACRYAPVLANYDAANLDPYFAAVLDGATGAWKKEFESTTGELREALAAGEVVSTAGDIQCAVKSADATSAEAVVVIGQTITSLGTRGKPTPGQLAMVMRMEKTDGRWLVDQMNTTL
ncbi:hypothetical protein [Nocardia sp. NBC_00416]|uniref:hypothetical protein n=1 Tax=Nocardia sp. NBC_00416 TaxID=2975991 RepID=UPI002E232D44